jgi:hypothetical protein
MNYWLELLYHLDAHTSTKQSAPEASYIENLSSRERLTQRFPTSSKSTNSSTSIICSSRLNFGTWCEPTLVIMGRGQEIFFRRLSRKVCHLEAFLISKPFLPWRQSVVTRLSKNWREVPASERKGKRRGMWMTQALKLSLWHPHPPTPKLLSNSVLQTSRNCSSEPRPNPLLSADSSMTQHKLC